MERYEYALDNKWAAARERLAQLEQIWDPWTIRNLREVGVREGWRCLEVAGGGGSIALWLSGQVGVTGQVTATDLEPHFLEGIKEPNITVQRHDILDDELPQAAFDLVHARALLTFLPDPKRIIAKLVAAVKPGGWLLLEEPDYVSAIPDPTMTKAAQELSRKGWAALLGHLKSKGYDSELGRRLYSEVVSAGIVDSKAEGFVAMQLGGRPSAKFWRITLEQIQDQVVASGGLTINECERYRELLDDPEYRWLSLLMMSVWGRRDPTDTQPSS